MNESFQVYSVHDEVLYLLPEKALYSPKYKTLLAADLHLGKVGHFREAGIALPGELAEADLLTLDNIINDYEVEQLIILGDLFHSGVNFDMNLFAVWREKNKDIQIDLIKGNHDVLSGEIYNYFNINTYKKYYLWHNILLTHEPMSDSLQLAGCGYVLCGHVHPAVRLVGKGRQSVKLPCFYFGEKQGILPAFGEFTGGFVVKPKPKEKVFVISEGSTVIFME